MATVPAGSIRIQGGRLSRGNRNGFEEEETVKVLLSLKSME
jgi:hypothetical protein